MSANPHYQEMHLTLNQNDASPQDDEAFGKFIRERLKEDGVVMLFPAEAETVGRAFGTIFEGLRTTMDRPDWDQKVAASKARIESIYEMTDTPEQANSMVKLLRDVSISAAVASVVTLAMIDSRD